MIRRTKRIYRKRRRSFKVSRRITKRRTSRRITKRRTSRRITKRRTSRRITKRSAVIEIKTIPWNSFADYKEEELSGKELGSGRDGTVYEYKDKTIIKCSKLYKTIGKPTLSRYFNEVSIGQDVGSAKLGPKIYKYGINYFKKENKYNTFIVMERFYPIDKSKICNMQKDFVDLFVKLSNLGIINDDPNPSNYMTTSTGALKMIDFGRAKYVPPKEALSKNMTCAILTALSMNGLFKNCNDCSVFVDNLIKHCNEDNIKTLGIMPFRINGIFTKLANYKS